MPNEPSIESPHHAAPARPGWPRKAGWFLLAFGFVLALSSAPVYFHVIEPRLARNTYEAIYWHGPPVDGEPALYRWQAVVDRHSTELPFNRASTTRHELVCLIVMVTDMPGGARFSGGGSVGHSSGGDGSDVRFEYWVSSTATEELGPRDDWTRVPETYEDRHFKGSGNRQQVTIAGKTYDLANGRVFYVDEKDRVQQLEWVPFEPTPESMDQQVRAMLRQRNLLP